MNKPDGNKWKVIVVENLVKKFGSFVANDHLNFEVGGGRDFWLPWCQWSRQDYSHANIMRPVKTNLG